MKLIFRDLTSPLLSFKCGSDPVSATISGMFGAADTAYTNETNRDVAEAQIAAQQRENQLNRDWQTSQAEINRQFQSAEQQKAYAQQTSERLASQEYQSQQWQHQFNEELLHRFDVPGGVNPVIYFSNKGAASGIGGSVSAPSGSAPSAPNGSMPAGVQGLSPVPYQAQRLDIPQMMQGISSIVQAKAAAKKAGAETDLINRSADDVIRKIKAEGDQMETLSSLNKLHVAIQQSKLPYAVKMAEQEYQESLAKIDLMKQEKLTSGEEAALKVATAKLNGALKSLYEKQGNELDVRLQYLPNLLQSQILSNRGSAAAGFATAENQSSLAGLHDWELSFNRSTQDYTISRLDQELRNLEKQGSILDWQIGAAEAAYDLQRNAADHAEELFWKDFVLDVVTGGVDAFTSVRNSRSWSRMSDASQRRVDARLKEIENQYGDKVELIDKSPSGKVRKRTYRRPYQKYGNTTD